MPELPEVHRVMVTLLPHLVGQRVVNVRLNRSDIVTGLSTSSALLHKLTISQIKRHGKQLAIIACAPADTETDPDTDPGQEANSPAVCVHLGMSGSLRYHPPAADLRRKLSHTPHTHMIWHLADGGALAFNDPRRFGGLWTFPNFYTLRTQRWAKLGDDALTITPKKLHARLLSTHRPIKASLLDQAIVAGLGNIYVDESLFTSSIHPLTPSSSLIHSDCVQLVRNFKAILKRAIASGGSTIRSYSDGHGNAGTFQNTLKVYGRGGQPCVTCGKTLITQSVIGRTTTLCQYCQGGFPAGSSSSLI